MFPIDILAAQNLASSDESRHDAGENAVQVGLQESRALAAKYSRRAVFRIWDPPSEPMSRMPREWRIQPGLEQEISDDIAPFVTWFCSQPEARERFRWALRDSLDEVLDGQRTGRWAYQHLTKTEKTYLGTAIEVNLTKEFAIGNGVDLDWSIAGVDIDCKFSKDFGGWEIPMEMYLCADHGERSGRANHPAVLTWVDDDTSQWAVGIVRITDERLRWKKGEAFARTTETTNVSLPNPPSLTCTGSGADCRPTCRRTCCSTSIRKRASGSSRHR